MPLLKSFFRLKRKESRNSILKIFGFKLNFKKMCYYYGINIYKVRAFYDKYCDMLITFPIDQVNDQNQILLIFVYMLWKKKLS